MKRTLLLVFVLSMVLTQATSQREISPVIIEPESYSANLMMRVYPSGASEFEWSGDAIMPPITEPSIGVPPFVITLSQVFSEGSFQASITSTDGGAEVYCEFVNVLTGLAALVLPDLSLHVLYQELKASADLSVVMPSILEVEVSAECAVNKLSWTVNSTFDATVEVWYTFLTPREMIESMVENFDQVRDWLSWKINSTTGGDASLTKLNLVSYQFKPLSAVLTLEGEIILYAQRVSPVVERFKATKNVKVDILELTVTLSREEATFECTLNGEVSGDLNEQVNRLKNACIEAIEEEMLSVEMYEFLNSVLKPLNVSACGSHITVTHELQEESGCILIDYDGATIIKPPIESVEDGFTMQSFFKGLSKAFPTPIENVTFTLEGGSTEETIVEIDVPPDVEQPEIKEPRKVRWSRINFTGMDGIVFRLKPNPSGVANVKVHVKRETIENATHTFLIFTNSTVKRITVTSEEVKLEVEGPSGTRGASNVTLPKAIVKGPISVYVDGEEVTPIVTENATHYFVYVTYVHSPKVIIIKWVEEVKVTMPTVPITYLAILAVLCGVTAIAYLVWKREFSRGSSLHRYLPEQHRGNEKCQREDRYQPHAA
jgi:hypothetical protein